MFQRVIISEYFKKYDNDEHDDESKEKYVTDFTIHTFDSKREAFKFIMNEIYYLGIDDELDDDFHLHNVYLDRLIDSHNEMSIEQWKKRATVNDEIDYKVAYENAKQFHLIAALKSHNEILDA